ncbi:MAG: NAD(P)H-hydrate dehydratase, partial [Candidatus Tectomicrobia bacterium]|nr:NAD(P)H-hydrate dehydratase [Candidatus Tectomicrobia bacterium]
NGGDGWVIARHLHHAGVSVQSFLLARRDQVQGDARINLEIAWRMGLPVEEIPSLEALPRLKEALKDAQLLVDALLGTGITAPLEGFYREVVSLVNARGVPVVAVDIPSGLSSDTGEILGEHIRADLTVTFGLPKRAQILYPAAARMGTLVVAEISIPARAIADLDLRLNLVTPQEIRRYLRPRNPEANKGHFGHVLVVAGSVGKTGAAAMASYSALRAGAGLVSLALPQSLSGTMETTYPEVMTLPLPETAEGTIDLAARDLVAELLPRMKVLVIGPGLTTHSRTAEFLREVLKETRVPTVVDADGLNGLADHLSLLQETSAPLILTPHPGEMSRLNGIPIAAIQQDRIEVAQRFAREHGVILVLKGARTVIANPEGRVYLNPTGNPGMATGGTGDILAGMIGGLVAQGWGLLEGVLAAVYLHGLAGDLAVQRTGEICLVATDLLDSLPAAIRQVIDAPSPAFGKTGCNH